MTERPKYELTVRPFEWDGDPSELHHYDFDTLEEALAKAAEHAAPHGGFLGPWEVWTAFDGTAYRNFDEVLMYRVECPDTHVEPPHVAA